MTVEINKQPGHTLMLCWCGMACLLSLADFWSGPYLQFPITFLIPVALASWFNGRWQGLIFAFVLPLIRFYFVTEVWTVPWTWAEAAVNAVIRIIVLSLFAIVIAQTSRQHKQLKKEVRLLEGLLPICAYCKKIRDDQSEWQPIEKYISERSPAYFSHGFCPDCLKKHYGDLFDEPEPKLPLG